MRAPPLLIACFAIFANLAGLTFGAIPPPSSEPLAPGDAIRKIHVPAGFKVELVASEPMLLDPVAFDWDERGRLWVVEMADYPLGMDNQGKPGGRVRVLEDTDGDGRYDKSTIFADGLNFPNGLITWRDGVIVTVAPNIIFLRDTNGDGRADQQTLLVSGLQEGNQQLRANGLRWGLDNWVYVAAGGHHGKYGVDTKLKSERIGADVLVGSRDFRFRPDTGELEPQSGPTQFGRNRDNWGRWFGSQNSNPLWEYVLPDHYLRRNPHAGVAETRVQLLTPANPPVFPASPLEKRYHSFDQSGRYTSACSGMILRDDRLFPAAEIHGFICEPFHNLVQHTRLKENGVTFTASRAEGESACDFFASEDRWCRPVMVREGPDGALWVADMYRYMIEHPQWLPPAGKDELTPHYRSGDDRGRIYRVIRKGAGPFRAVRFDKMSTAEVVAALDTTNGWQRDKAQQVLLWRRDKSAIALLQALAKSANPLARLHVLCTLDGLGELAPEEVAHALADEAGGVRENALRLAETRFTPEVLVAAIKLVDDADAKVRLQLAFSLGASADPQAGEALARLIMKNTREPMIVSAAMSSATPHLRALAKLGKPMEPLLNTALGLNDRDALATLLGPDLTPASLTRVLGILTQHGSSLDKLRGASDDALTRTLVKADAIFTKARSTANDADASVTDRIAAGALLGCNPTSRSEAVQLLAAWLSPQHPAGVQSEALRVLGDTAADGVPAMLAKAWPSLGPASRQTALGVWMSREAWVLDLLLRIERAEIAASSVEAVQRSRLLKHDSTRVRQLAAKLFSTGTDTLRAKVVDSYRTALALKGDAGKGRDIYLRNCSVCHRHGSDGKDIGPDLASVVSHPPEKLLTAILDPNADIQPGFIGYTCTLGTGEQVYGLVASETASSVTMKLPDASLKTVLRSQIASLQSQNLSLMPEGFEAAINKEDMAHLIEFLRTPVLSGENPESASAAAPAFHSVSCEGSYPRHVQGICTNGQDAIYWSWTDALVKTDLEGRVLKRVPVASHHGDLCFSGGRVYVATNLGRFNQPAGAADSWVYVYDGDTLSEVARHQVPELVHGAGGMEWHDGKFFLIGGLPQDANENYIYEYDESFRFRKRHVLASGYTLMGIQTVAHANGAWWFGCYGKPDVLLRADEKFQITGRWEFKASFGIAPVGGGRFLIAQNTAVKGADGKVKGNHGGVVVARLDENSGLVTDSP